jgi:branched-chain amino acid transport system substrate-binding protein
MTRTKRVLAGFTAAALALSLTACGDDSSEPDATDAPAPAGEDSEPAAEPAAEGGDFSLGVAFDTGGRGDGTFNDAAGRGADVVEADLGATVQELEANSNEDRQPNLEALAGAGNDLIVAVGFAFGDALGPVAEANPETWFGWIDGYFDGPNIITTAFAEHEGSFLVGAAAALKSASGTIGFIGGQEIDLIKKFEAGYIAGAMAVNPDIVVESQYLGAAGDNAAWGSPDKAKEIALAWYNAGADVVYTAAGGSGRGTIEAAVEAGEGKWAIGVDSDEYFVDTPEQQAHRLTSMLKRVDTAVIEMANAVNDGTAEGGFYPFNLANDGVGYATSGGHIDDIVDELEALKAQIISGAITVPTVPGEMAEISDTAGDGVLRLGGILPETGNLAFLGPPEFAGAELAVQEINAAGGVLGNDVEWLPGDSGDNGEVANATVDRLLAENVDGFIGAASSGVSLTVIDKITQAGKIHFSPANTSPTFTDYDDNGLYFRTAPSDVVQGAALADVMINDGATTAAFLVLNDSYGTGLLKYTKEPYEAAGGEVVYEVVYDPQAENFDAEVAATVDADPDAIVIIGFDETTKILTGLIEAGMGPDTKMVYGTDGNMGNALAAAFDDPTVVAGMKGTLPGVDVGGELPDFRDRLLSVDPDLTDFSYSAETYDAIVVTALAAIAAGSDDGIAVGAEINDITRGGEKCTSFTECADLLAAGTDIDYDGVSGPLEFIDAGEPSEASILILEFDADGALQVIGSVNGKV